MMKLLPFFGLFFVISPVTSQEELCKAIVYWRYEGGINVYDVPGGELLQTMVNDRENENYLTMLILDQVEEYFLVEIWPAMTQEKVIGWIRKEASIGALMRNESEYMDVKLYQHPTENESAEILVEKWEAGFVTINECKGDWLHVTLRHNGTDISGWISKWKLCPNNYTTCG